MSNTEIQAATSEVATSPTVTTTAPAVVVPTAPALVPSLATNADKLTLARTMLETAKLAYAGDEDSTEALTSKPGAAIKLIQQFVGICNEAHSAGLEGRDFQLVDAQTKIICKVMKNKWHRSTFINGISAMLFLGSQKARKATVQPAAIHIGEDGARSIALPNKSAKGTFPALPKGKITDTPDVVSRLALEAMEIRKAELAFRVLCDWRVSTGMMQALGKVSFDVIGLAAKAKKINSDTMANKAAWYAKLTPEQRTQFLALAEVKA